MANERRLVSIKALIESFLIKTSTTITNNPLETHITNIPLDIKEPPVALTMNAVTTMVANVSVDILPANVNRKLLLVQNTSNSQETVYINFKTPATLGTGVALGSGESFIFPKGFIYTGVLSAISATATNKPITVTEGA